MENLLIIFETPVLNIINNNKMLLILSNLYGINFVMYKKSMDPYFYEQLIKNVINFENYDKFLSSLKLDKNTEKYNYLINNYKNLKDINNLIYSKKIFLMELFFKFTF